jgi:hypothetical protein
MQTRKERTVTTNEQLIKPPSEVEKIKKLIDKADNAVLADAIFNIKSVEDTSTLVSEMQTPELETVSTLIEPAKEQLSIEPIIEHKSFMESLPDAAFTSLEADVTVVDNNQQAPSIVNFTETPRPANIRIRKRYKNATDVTQSRRKSKFNEARPLKEPEERKRSYRFF